jgi:hypothetical protein
MWGLSQYMQVVFFRGKPVTTAWRTCTSDPSLGRLLRYLPVSMVIQRPLGSWLAVKWSSNSVYSKRLHCCKRVLSTMLQQVCDLFVKAIYATTASASALLGMLMLLLNVHNLVAAYLWCSNSCNNKMPYDGYVDAIFNYSNASLFTYELCFNYADGMVVSRLPFATHWQQLQRNYVRAQREQLLCSRITHRCSSEIFCNHSYALLMCWIIGLLI